MSSVPGKTIEHLSGKPIRILGPLWPLPPTAVTYSFWIPQFVIHTTRALLRDTDFATLGVAVTAADGTTVAQYGPAAMSLGDLGDGTHVLNMHIAGISVPEGGSMAVAFTILNHGSLKAVNDIGQVLIDFGSNILTALASGKMAAGDSGAAAGAGILGLSDWEEEVVALLGPAVLQGLEDLLADCDGLVVTGSFSLSASELAAKAGQAPWTWSTEYAGTSSNTGCGANSDYTVSYSVMASPPCVTVPDLVGAQPARVAALLSPLGLIGEETATSKADVDAPVVGGQSPMAGFIVPPSTVVEYQVHIPEGGAHQLP